MNMILIVQYYSRIHKCLRWQQDEASPQLKSKLDHGAKFSLWRTLYLEVTVLIEPELYF